MLLTLFAQNPIVPPGVYIADPDVAGIDSTGHDISDIDDLAALTILNALANKKLIGIICHKPE